MVLALTVCLLTTQQQQLPRDLTFQIPEPIFAGEREILLGPKEYSDSIMSLIYSKDKPASLDMKGINPPIWEEYPIGSIRWSVKPGTFGSQSCMVVKNDVIFRPQYHYAFKGKTRQTNVTLDIRGVSQWWVTADGKILRQYEQRTDDRGVRTANCTYGTDSIEVSVEEFGKRRVTTLFPGDMQLLQNQFKPMVVDGRVVMSEKPYAIYNPFTSGFEKHIAKVGGAFQGTYLSQKFEGLSLVVDGYDKDGEFRAYVSKEGDLVKMDLPKDRYLVLQSVPPARAAIKGPNG